MDQPTRRKGWILISLFLLSLSLGAVLTYKGLDLFKQEDLYKELETNTPQIEESTTSAVQGLQGQEVLVTEVIDGDTIEVEGGIKVRYIGIDTPETVDPRRGVQCFGREASNENKKIVEGKIVILVKDVSETDKFGRFLRYVYVRVENGETLFVNDYLVRGGFAKTLTYPPDVRFTQQFIDAERDAKEFNLGLWQKC